MGIAGPRLDSPSAIGDEGRPRTTSLTVAAVLVTGLCVSAGLWVGTGTLLGLAGTAITVFVTGMTLLQRNSFRSLFGGHLCLHTGALGVLTLLVVSVIEGQLVVAMGFVAALVGIATSWTDTLDGDSFRRALSQGGRSYASAFAVVVIGSLFVSVVFVVYMLVQWLLATSEFIASLVGFFFFLSVVAFLVTMTIRRAPLNVLVPKTETSHLLERLERLRRYSEWTAIGSFVLAAASVAMAASGLMTAVVSAVPVVRLLVSVATSVFVVGPLAILGTVALLVGIVLWRLPKVADAVDTGDYDTLAAWSAGVVLAVGAMSMLVTPIRGGTFGALGIFGALVGPPIALLLLLYLPSKLAGGYMARQASGPAVSAAGLVVLGIGANGAGVSTLLTFACIAGAVVVWDVSTFGTGLTVELGHIPETRRLELYHALLSIGVGTAAVLTLAGIDYFRRLFGSTVGAMPAVVLAVAGVLVLVIADWRR